MLPASPSSQLVRANEQTRMRWANGAGWTREIHAEPSAASAPVVEVASMPTPAWSWRLSVAEIERPAPCSRLPGIEREMLLLHGEGVRLVPSGADAADANANAVELQPPQGRHRFAGEAALHIEPTHGPCQVLNLMWRRDCWDATLWRRPLVGSMLLFLEAGEHGLVHLLAGTAAATGSTGAVALHPGDTWIVRSGTERERLALDGVGEVVLARLAVRG